MEEVPTRLDGGDDGAYLHDFGVLVDDAQLDCERDGERLAEAITAVWSGRCESDSLNALIIRAGLDCRRRRDPARLPALPPDRRADVHRRVPERRARARTRRRRACSSSSSARASATSTRRARGGAARATRRAAGRGRQPRRGPHPARLRRADRRHGAHERRARPRLPLVQAALGRRARRCRARAPLFEIFVYHPQVEGIHLRGGHVARGGIRWSDRREDYRTEVLGPDEGADGQERGDRARRRQGRLRAAQPAGRARRAARGGAAALLDADPRHARRDRQHRRRRGRAPAGRARLRRRRPVPRRRRRQGHRGALRHGQRDRARVRLLARRRVRVRRLARATTTRRSASPRAARGRASSGTSASSAATSTRAPFTVVGIGDMSGDVFGNGMLLSRQIQLIAAFDHRHVFLDPTPDAAPSFAERARLFALGAGTSWADYDRAADLGRRRRLVAHREVGAALARGARRARRRRRARSTPTSSCAAILRAPVDLLWNGGIGTFVKASERDARGGRRPRQRRRPRRRPRAARARRRRGRQPRAHAARAHRVRDGRRAHQHRRDRQLGGRRLLGPRGQHQDPARRWRRARACSRSRSATRCSPPLADEVCELVLYDNYLQAQILSQEQETAAAARRGARDADARARARGPARPRARGAARERRARGAPAPGPRPDAPRAGGAARLRQAQPATPRCSPRRCRTTRALDSVLRAYFPRRIVEATGELYREHRLRREIVATFVTNDVVNSLGIAWAWQMMAETGAEAAEVVRALLDRPRGHRAPWRAGRRSRRCSPIRPSTRTCRWTSWAASTGSSRASRAGTCSTRARATQRA